MDQLPSVDVHMAVVSEAEDRFRFNQDHVYTARETAVLARCTVVDIVHGFGSEGDLTPCTLLVFDFELDRIKVSRTIHESVISLILGPGIKVRKKGLAPKGRVRFDPQKVNVSKAVTYGGKAAATPSSVATLEGSAQETTTTVFDQTHYAAVHGWTTHHPRPLHNTHLAHNCVKWSLVENEVKKNGVPPCLRASVLLERPGDDEFQLQVQMDTTADLATGTEDLVSRLLLFGRTPTGKLKVDPLTGRTANLKSYDTAGLDAEVRDMFALSLGRLAVDEDQDTSDTKRA